MLCVDFLYCSLYKTSHWSRNSGNDPWIASISLLAICVMSIFVGGCLYLEYFCSIGMRILDLCFPSGYIFLMEYGAILFIFWYVYVYRKRSERLLREYNRKKGLSFMYNVPHQVVTLFFIVGALLIPISAGILLGYKNGWGND